MRDDGLDGLEDGVGGGLGGSQQEPIVEDVEALVLHGAHVEVGHGDDVEHVEIVLTAEALLVPPHGALERIHRPRRAFLLAVLDVDAERDLAPRHGAERGRDRGEITADERKQIAGLGEGIAPHRVMALAALEHAALEQVAVRQEDRRLVGVGLDAHRVGGEHVGAVEEIRDAAEAFGLALGAVDVVGAVKARERLIGLRVDEGDDLERERLRWRLEQGQAAVGEPVVLLAERLEVERDRSKLEVFAVEPQRDRLERPSLAARVGIGADREARAHARACFVEVEVECDLVDEVGGRTIVLEMDGARGLGLHGENRFFRGGRAIPREGRRCVHSLPRPYQALLITL